MVSPEKNAVICRAIFRGVCLASVGADLNLWRVIPQVAVAKRRPFTRIIREKL